MRFLSDAIAPVQQALSATELARAQNPNGAGVMPSHTGSCRHGNPGVKLAINKKLGAGRKKVVKMGGPRVGVQSPRPRRLSGYQVVRFSSCQVVRLPGPGFPEVFFLSLTGSSTMFRPDCGAAWWEYRVGQKQITSRLRDERET